MHLEGLVARLKALKQLRLNVGFACRRDQRLDPILRREYVIDLRAGLDQARPPHESGNAITAFPVGVLLAAERRSAAIRPCEGLSTIVGRVNDDSALRDPEIVEFLEQLTDLAVMLDHSVRIETEPRLSLGFRLEPGPDMHPSRIHPCEERFLVLVRAVNEVLSCLEKFFVRG